MITLADDPINSLGLKPSYQVNDVFVVRVDVFLSFKILRIKKNSQSSWAIKNTM